APVDSGMCGIMAYAGRQDALPVVLDGLRRLEYRGYDSAGVAVVVTAQSPSRHQPLADRTVALALAATGRHGNAPGGAVADTGARVVVRRAPGKLERLVTAVADDAGLSGRVAIGHTRWATHGPPTERNAHPHADCAGRTVVVHNGIVENYEVLRAELQAEGHRFASQTDSEVIAHLIERQVDAGVHLADATRRALTEIRGANAVTVVHAGWPDLLLAGRTGHAGGLVLGQGEGEMYVASDLPAILERTRTVAFLESGDLAVIDADGASVTRLDGTPVERPFQTVPYDPLAAAKGGYRHFMLKEIHEQPRALLDTLQGRLLPHAPWARLEDFRLDAAAVRRLRKVTLVGCGTAWHAGLVGKFLIEELAGIPVEVEYASEFRYRRPLLDGDTLVVAISQSGETADTLVSMEAARSAGAQIMGIVNVVGSQAARLALASAGVLYTRAGPEIGVASTKAFTSQLVALALLALHLGGVRQAIEPDAARAFVQSLEALPDQAAAVLGHTEPATAAGGGDLTGHALAALAARYEALAARCGRAQDVLYIGRGGQYPIALEGALKLKEISYIHAEGYPAGEMKHGPIALIDGDVPVVAIALRDRVYDKMLSNIQEARAREGQVIAVGTAGDDALAAKADDVLFVPDTDPRLAPVLSTIPMQLLAYYVAVRRGCDVDQPRNLAKSVTVE
ncbi:MAG TPA: glutamine--fructose-6-phosphate transaminase (isomerizing), partial [Chloroflexota bacterium]|nr:glutamine--fructose-6-phosphate transaminase (isomerizing) [Chloroflexota bacterium]